MVDLIAMNALYRPGPIAYIDEYIQNNFTTLAKSNMNIRC